MRERLTYFHPLGTAINPESIKFADSQLDYLDYRNATIEKRITLSLEELNDKHATAIGQSHELYIRWTRPRDFHHITPLVSRLPTGLHVFYTPRSQEQKTLICALLKNLFSIDGRCVSPKKSFSSPSIVSERFASTATYQYYRSHHDIASHPSWSSLLCPQDVSKSKTDHQCLQQAKTLREAAEVYLDFDAISNVLVLTAVWSPNPRMLAGSPQDQSLSPKSFKEELIEVGFLSPEKADEPEEIKLGGFLLDGGKGRQGATLFSFPARHHQAATKPLSNFEMSLQQPTGLHPEVILSFPRQALSPPDESCALHAYFTIPSAIFLDRYQLMEQSLLKSKNLVALRALSGAEDLEAPDWTIEQWGSAALFQLSHPANSSFKQSGKWNVHIPMHLRYLQQSSSTADSNRNISIPWPAVFWACEAQEGLKMSINPFDRTNLGYDGLFGPKTMFYHIPPASGSSLYSIVKVPILKASNGVWLPGATLVTVLLGLIWIAVSLLKPLSATADKRRHHKAE